MEKAMTPSGQTEMTQGQINKAVSNYRALLEKHRSELGSEAAQSVIGSSQFATEQLALFRKYVGAASEMVVRRVRVKRSRTPQQALDATGRHQHVDPDVVAEMPGQGEDEDGVDVCFFPLRKFASVADVQKAFEEHGLKPDAYAVSAVNEADPNFADSHPNGTQWVVKGSYCYVAFYWWDDQCDVRCRRDVRGWDDDWWLGGVRK